jgi:hypothetical protein
MAQHRGGSKKAAGSPGPIGGGPDAISNMQWQTVADAKVKGGMTLSQ